MQGTYFSIATLWILLLTSCGGGAPAADTDSGSPYFVDDASYLYFKNLRVKDYTLEERQTPRVDVYRHRGADAPADQPHLRIALVDNWLQDEAYLQIDLVDATGASLGPVRLSPNPASAESETLYAGSGKPADALALARYLQAAARQRRIVTFATEGGELEELAIEVAEFSPQLTTINDYLRLIDG